MIYLVKIYQSSLSFFLGGNCKFYPSCSCYAVEALEVFSTTKALKLIAIRLLKCHPLSKSPLFDPLPSQPTFLEHKEMNIL